MTRQILTMLAVALAAFLPSCEVRPSYRDPQGGVATLGGHIFLKKNQQKGKLQVEYPDGRKVTLSDDDTMVDGTVVPAKAIGAYTTTTLGGYVRDAHRTTEGTKRFISGQETQRAATSGAQANEALRIKNPLLEGQTPNTTR